MWMTSCTVSARGGFWEFWKVSELSLAVRRRRVTFACSPWPGQWPCGRCRTCFGADGKASIERLCLSPYVEKPLNLKVIKSFVPELRSRKCFSGFLSFMLCMCVMNIMNVLRTGMNMYVSHMYGYVTHTHSIAGFLCRGLGRVSK